MEIQFKTKGHSNILCKHRNTIEFTKERDLTLNGDCILGVDSNFSFEDIKKALTWSKVRMKMIIDDKEEIVEGIVNKGFKSKSEIVFRKSGFISDRTLLIRCDKACVDLRRDFVQKMISEDAEMTVILKKID